MRPSSTLLILLGAWLAGALALSVARLYEPASGDALAALWWLAGGLLAAAAAIDAARRGDLRHLEVERTLPESLAVGVKNTLELHFINRTHRRLRLQVAEDQPPQFDVQGLPAALTLAREQTVRLIYQAVPQRRGDAVLGRPWVRVSSRWGLWQFLLRPGSGRAVKVFPDFASIRHFAALDIERQIEAMGVHRQQRRGEGMDFHQLREFREGDALRQVDWKATSRLRKPISREYQEERDQDIIFLLDCGRRMRAKDAGLSHFDCALNALLLTGHVALRQGDAVGLLSFAGTERWQPPLKGQSSINRLLQRVYDLHSSTDSSDFLQAAQRLLQHHRKRALIVLLSNIHDEDADDLSAAVHLLGSRHLVLVASLRETWLDQPLQRDVTTLDDALMFAGAHQYRAERRRLLQRLRQSGTAVIDSPPERLHVDLVAQYWLMKRGGLI